MGKEKQFMVLFNQDLDTTDLFIPNPLSPEEMEGEVIKKGQSKFVDITEMFEWLNISRSQEISISIYEVNLKHRT